MSQSFVLKEFILQTSPSFLKEYCRLHNIPLTLPTTDNEDEAKEAIIKQLSKLDDKSRSSLELDFQEINSLTPNEGLHLLIEEAKGKNLQIPYEEVDQLNQHDKAFWFFLHQNEHFSDVATWYEVNDTRGWKELTGVKKVKDISKITGKTAQLQKALSTYIFNSELRGRNCYVECYRQEDRVCFVAYPEDYTESSIVYEEEQLRKRHPHKPVDKIFFLYYPKEGRLSTKAAGGWKRAKTIQQIFGKAVLGVDLNVDSDRVFNLDVLKSSSFTFPTPPEDKVEFVKLKQLQLKFFGGTRKLNLEVSEDTNGVQAIHEFIRELKIPLSRLFISKGVFQIKFETTIKRSRGTLTFFVAWPNSHNINDNPRYRKVKNYLKDWGLEYQFEEILDTLLSFDQIKEITTSELNRLFTASVTRWATDNGIYKKVEPLKEVQCKTCHESHKVQSRNDSFFYFCPTSGSKEWIDKGEIERWTLNSKNFLTFLATELELAGKLREIEAGKIWLLGNLPGAKVPVYYFNHKADTGTLDKTSLLSVVISPEKITTKDSNLVFIPTSDLVTLIKGLVTIDKEYFNDFVSGKIQRVKFEVNGDLWIDHQNVVQVTPGTPQYNFVMSLWNNFNNPVGHEEIHKFCIGEMAKIQGVDADKWRDEYTPQSFSNKMKSLIKKSARDEATKALIDKVLQPTKTVKGDNAYRLTYPR